MFGFDTTDIQRFAMPSLGALVLATACVALIAPASAAESNAPFTVGDWQAVVEQRIDQILRVPAHSLDERDHAVTTVNIRFDAHGDFAEASVGQSSGIRSIDAEALRVARTLSYPALPEGFRGRPRTVAMQLYFGQAADVASYARQEGRARAMAEMAKGDRKADENVQVASMPAG